MPQDNNTKTFLILSASYGSGHVRAAEALVEHLTQAGYTASHIDLLSFASPLQARILRAPYIILMRHFPQVYGWLYHILTYPIILTILRISYTPIILLYQKKIRTRIIHTNVDTIICTHFTWGDILDRFIDQDIDIPPYYMVVTDYTYHPMWKNTHGKGYLLGAESIRTKCIKAGILPELLYVTGIPVSPKFGVPYTSKKDRITILLGGYGLVYPTHTIKETIHTYPDTPIHIVCGNNRALVHKLQKRYGHIPHVTIHGWIDTIQEYIRNSIFVITKTGGITITECLVAQIPIQALDPIPGQEEENYMFLADNQLLFPDIQQKDRNVIPIFNPNELPCNTLKE
jgi:processive 1,2-diacylglycerol beta-glucosyltransferase